jgi:hypothetical protein
MDASRSKDYVLFMLFIECISDKYGNSDDLVSLRHGGVTHTNESSGFPARFNTAWRA